MIDFRTLTQTPLAEIHRAFLSAFEDYAVKQQPDRETLRRMMVRRGADLSLSVGAFDGEELVGVTMLATGEWDDDRTAYDVFTGIVPSHRGRGLAGAMLEFALPLLRDRGVVAMLLEVIQGNAPAVRAYARQGFEIERELICFGVAWPSSAEEGVARRVEPAAEAETHGADPAIVARPGIPPEARRLASEREWSPSWQNRLAAIDRSIDDVVTLLACVEGEPVGYLVVTPARADIAQFLVSRPFRRRGIGRRLLRDALSQAGRGCQVLNLHGEASDDHAFVRAAGGLELVRQYEMRRRID